jgi:hypothetical protein
MAAAATTLIERGRRFTQVEGRRGMSADGSLVAFVTNSSLVPRDVNGGPDIYEWHDGQLGLISDGTSEYGIFGSERLGLLDVAPDGKNILFANAAKLTEDGIPGQPQVQVYTARVDGGFTKAQLASCEADACRAQPAAPSPAAAAATSSFAGPGNAKSRRHRAKHRRAKHHRKAHGQANDNRRTSR